jgi:hypothetical protein
MYYTIKPCVAQLVVVREILQSVFASTMPDLSEDEKGRLLTSIIAHSDPTTFRFNRNGVRDIQAEFPHIATRTIYEYGARVRKKRAAGENPLPSVQSKRPKHCGRHSKLDDALHAHYIDILQCCAKESIETSYRDVAKRLDDRGIHLSPSTIREHLLILGVHKGDKRAPR